MVEVVPRCAPAGKSVMLGGVAFFAAKAGALERVVLPRTVLRRSTGKFGIIIEAAPGELPRWLVAFDGQMLTVAEADLRPHVLDDPRSGFERFGTRLGGPGYRGEHACGRELAPSQIDGAHFSPS